MKIKVLKKKDGFRPTQVIAFGFMAVILLGSVLLSLPIASAKGVHTDYIDALFTATTSVCVTGLVTVSTANNWSYFGQAVILVLIQIGGLGVVSMAITAMVLTRKRIGLKNRILIRESYGLESLQGVVVLIKKIVKGTFIVEGVGALCFLPVLCQKRGLRGIWDSVFLSISAFCNAGMDTLGDNSMMDYVGNYWICTVIMLLIILGGLGYLVWWELLRLGGLKIKEKKSFSFLWKKTTLHTKIVLSTTLFLILAGTIAVLICEYTNPQTLAPLSFPQKILASCFQSVTTRTAGFASISQSGMKAEASMFCMVLMFIGGSPAGTAGGVKTVTVAMIFFAVVAAIKGQEETRAFHRSVSDNNIKKGLAVIITSLGIWLFMTMILCGVENADFMKTCYETVSAIATVGLSKDFTATLHVGGKIIVILLMYFGRIGPITLATLFLVKGRNDDLISLPEENILIG